MAKINQIRLSGTTYSIEDSGATESISLINAAISGKQDTLVSGTNIKTINNESLLGSGNIDIQGGGGKAIEAGRGISITTGETADTVSFNLSLSSSTIATDSIVGGYFGNTSMAQYGFAYGDNAKCGNSGAACMAFGSDVTANAYASFVTGYHNEGTNQAQAVFGKYSVNNKANGTFGDSGNTLFSVGNGTSSSARHNAFEIRQNGDIYISSGGTDIKLQDNLGGGGSSYTAGTGIDITNDVISVSGVVMTSAITTTITSSSTDAQVPSAKAVYDQIGNINTILESI